MKFLDKLEESINALALLASTVILFINIFLRYTFSAGFPWAEEAVRYLIVVVTFIGLGIGIRDGQVIRMDILLQLMKKSSAVKLEKVVNVLACLFSICLAVIAYKFAMQTKAFGQITSALQLPFYVLYLIITVGSLLSAVRYLQAAFLPVKESEANSVGEAQK
ncbi:MAG: TRAP transporter small permease [Firmicutes bacterium]|nr:TRAP transporter small permease [Bacillota bacterium]